MDPQLAPRKEGPRPSSSSQSEEEPDIESFQCNATSGETAVPQSQYSEDQGPCEPHWDIQGWQLRGTWQLGLRESRTAQVEGGRESQFSARNATDEGRGVRRPENARQ